MAVSKCFGEWHSGGLLPALHAGSAPSSTPDVFQTNVNLMGFSQLASCSRAQLSKRPVRAEG